MVRYRLFGVISGKRMLCLILCACIILILGFLLYGYTQRLKYEASLVKHNVFFNETNMSTLTEAEVRAKVSILADALTIPPIDAEIDSITKGVIPDLNGLSLDIEQTVSNIMNAAEGSEIEPGWVEVPASTTLSHFPNNPVYQGNPHKEQVTFLINVAWGNEYLADIFEVLKQFDAQATFFLVGRWVRDNREAAASIAQAGFEIANHGFSDAISMAEASLKTAEDDILAANNIIAEVCGVEPLYFSPHRGEITDTVLQAASNQNTRVIMWTVDTVDWKKPGIDWMVEKVENNVDRGSLILMHPTEDSAEFLRQMIPILEEKGLKPVKLSALLSPQRIVKEEQRYE